MPRLLAAPAPPVPALPRSLLSPVLVLPRLFPLLSKVRNSLAASGSLLPASTAARTPLFALVIESFINFGTRTPSLRKKLTKLFPTLENPPLTIFLYLLW